MHVRAILGSRAKSSDVKLAQLSFLRQLNVMAKIAVVPLEEKGKEMGWRALGRCARGSSLGTGGVQGLQAQEGQACAPTALLTM